MPHIIVSYAKEIEDQTAPKKLVEAAWEGAAASGLFGKKDIKARALPVVDYITGESDKPFIHVDVKLLPGRTDEQKAALNKLVLDYLVAVVDENIEITVNASDLAKASYAKRA